MIEALMARLRGENKFKLDDLQVRLAVAALLSAAERADVSESELENSIIDDSLVYLYHLSREDARHLAQSGAKIEEACSDIKDVTDLIKSQSTVREREQILSEVWEVLVGDHVIGIREQSFARRLTQLLGLSSECGDRIRKAVIAKDA